MSIISKSEALEKVKSRVSNFFIQKQIGKLLKQSNFYKESGFTCIELTKFVFLLVFGRNNLYQTLQSEDADKPGKDTVYRFLNSCRFNWRKFLLLLRKGINEYMIMYNTYRPHDSLGGDVPMNVYYGESAEEVA